MSSLSPEQLTEIRARAEAVPLEPPFSHGAFAIADRRKLLAHIDACFAPEPGAQHQRLVDYEEQLREVDTVLTDMGWHTDRGLLYRVRQVIDAYSPETKREP